MERTRKFAFFKVILDCTIQDKKLRLPPKFIRKYRQELSDMRKAKLKVLNRNGSEWQLDMKKEEDTGILFDGGFEKFIEYHSIRHGYFLVFQYGGQSSFEVTIFDPSACEVDYPCGDPNNDAAGPSNIDKNKMGEDDYRDYVEILDDDDDDDDDQSVEILAEDACPPGTSKMASSKKVTPSHEDLPRTASNGFGHLGINKAAASWERKRKGKDILIEEDGADDLSRSRFKKRVSIAEPEFEKEEIKITYGHKFNSILAKASQRTKDAVRWAKMYKPKNPSFLLIMQAHNMSCTSAFLYVPTKFSKRYLQEIGEDIELRNSDGKGWLVQARWRTKFGIQLYRGWKEFSEDNSLEVGDVCLFEVIRLEGMVALHAVVFHAF